MYEVNYFVIGNLMNHYSKKQLPTALMSLFKTNKEIHNYNTRANKKILKPMSKTKGNSLYVIRE